MARLKKRIGCEGWEKYSAVQVHRYAKQQEVGTSSEGK